MSIASKVTYTSLFGTDGIRDKANEGALSPQNVRRLGRVTGYLLRRSPALFGAKKAVTMEISIARDTRESGGGVGKNLTDGFIPSGIDVHSVGVLPSSALGWLTRRGKYSLGCVISASHNRFDDNGIKFFSSRGMKIPDRAERAIERYFFAKDDFSGKTLCKGKRKVITADYVDGIVRKFGNAISLKGIRIVIDCANGATYRVAPDIFRKFGADVVVINNKPNGRNINSSCGALHPALLSKVVLREKADLGVAFDGDGDRAIFVDEEGNIRDGDYVLAICATRIKKKTPLFRTVVSTVMANYGLEHYLKNIGIKLLRTKVGDKFVCAEMMKRKLPLGGEQSGHIIFLDILPTGDGIITALKVLEAITNEGKTMTQLCSVLQKFPQQLINVKVASKPQLTNIKSVKKILTNGEEQLNGNGRIVLRYSGTEQLARVMVEGRDEKLVDAIAKDIAEAIRCEIGV